MSIRETASARMAAPRGTVFDFVTDPSALPSWNRVITDVVESPGPLGPGSVWKVRLHALGQSWVSTSRVTTLEPESGRFTYRSQTDDGNPSFADWEWHIQPDGDGSVVSVTVDLHPTTFWRKHLLVKVRRRALRKEMHDSLGALEAALPPEA